MWCKFVVNVGINQASAIFRGSYGALRDSKKAYAFVLELMQEAVSIAQKVGINKADALLPWAENFIRNMPPAFKSSMLQDIEAGKKTEVDIFGGAVCALGEKYSVPTPQNAQFVWLIKALEETAH
jgi:2-dehydropantoate 2-reductase